MDIGMTKEEFEKVMLAVTSQDVLDNFYRKIKRQKRQLELTGSRYAHDVFTRSFTWRKTKEGQDYWEEIYNKLFDYTYDTMKPVRSMTELMRRAKEEDACLNGLNYLAANMDLTLSEFKKKCYREQYDYYDWCISKRLFKFPKWRKDGEKKKNRTSHW